jgi:hypothetical protein
MQYFKSFEKFTTDNPDIQELIDIISMNPVKYAKYKQVLLDEHGIDFDKIFHDEEFIRTANLDDIKSKKDFMDWDNYVRYAKEIYKLRNIPYFDNSTPYTISNDEIFEVADKLNFEVVFKAEYGYQGYKYASYGGSKITLPKDYDVDTGTFIHELGHHYDFTEYKEGISKEWTNSITRYGLSSGGEAFAENFAAYFINAEILKKYLPHVYADLDKHISPHWKSVINMLIKNV